MTSRSRSPSCAVAPTSSPSSTTWPAGSPPSTTPARCSTRWPGRPAGCSASTSPTSCCCAPTGCGSRSSTGRWARRCAASSSSRGRASAARSSRRAGPLSSERYLEDTRFPHGEGTDAAALSEQLGGILGVPLVVGDDTLGVLLAAERRPRAFGDRDVELLAGLAAHAALALRTADLFDRERAAAADLRSANETLRAVSESRQRASDLRDVLNDVVIRGGGLAAVVTALERSAGLAVEVRDHDGRTLAGEPPAEGGLVVPVDLPSGHGGDLVAAPTGESDDEETLRLLRIGATTVAVLMASERSVAEAELRTRGEFVHALLSSDADEASLLRRARAIGIDLHAVTTVAVVDAEPVGATAAAAFAARLAAELRGWSAAHAGQVVVLLPAAVDRAREAVARLAGQDGAHPHDGPGRR